MNSKKIIKYSNYKGKRSKYQGNGIKYKDNKKMSTFK
jgi:hypothetical protein